jgi:hypothetical protein
VEVNTPLIRAAFSFSALLSAREHQNNFHHFQRRVFGRQLVEQHTIRFYRLARTNER